MSPSGQSCSSAGGWSRGTGTGVKRTESAPSSRRVHPWSPWYFAVRGATSAAQTVALMASMSTSHSKSSCQAKPTKGAMSPASTVSGVRSVTRPTTKVPEQRWCAAIPAAYFRKRPSSASSAGSLPPPQAARIASAIPGPRSQPQFRRSFIARSSRSNPILRERNFWLRPSHRSRLGREARSERRPSLPGSGAHPFRYDATVAQDQAHPTQ